MSLALSTLRGRRNTSPRIICEDPAFYGRSPDFLNAVTAKPKVIASESAESDQVRLKAAVDLLKRSAEALEEAQLRCERLQIVCEDLEARLQDVVTQHDHDIAQLRLTTEFQQVRADKREACNAGLEARLAEADVTEQEHRSRFVCLYGKLSVSADTLRLRTMTLALAEQRAPPVDSEASKTVRVLPLQLHADGVHAFTGPISPDIKPWEWLPSNCAISLADMGLMTRNP